MSNYYLGLSDFAEMGFLLHALRPDDLFVDVGANIGAYTVLASAAIGSRAVAVEPIPATYCRLVDNIRLNDIAPLVNCLNIGVGRDETVLTFTADGDTCNHVVRPDERVSATMSVPIKPLDAIMPSSPRPARVFIKIDVEGYTAEVLAGAAHTLAESSVGAAIVEHSQMVERYGASIASIHGEMLRHGFVPCTYDPLAREVVRLELSIPKAWIRFTSGMCRRSSTV